MSIENEVTEALDKIEAQIKTHQEKADAELKATGKVATDTASALEGLKDRLRDLEQKMVARRGGGDFTAAKSVAQQLSDSDDFKALQAKGKGEATIKIKATNLTSLTTDAAGSVGDAITAHRLPGILPPAERVLTIRDVLMAGNISLPTVEDVRETGNDFTAGPVAEGNEATQSDIKLDLFTSHARLMSHYMVASVQVLSDVPLLTSYVNTRLLYGLNRVVENQIIAGPGTGQNLLGLKQQAAEFNESGLSAATDTEIDTVRRAALQVRMAELKAGWIAMNPVSWAGIELMKSATDSHYIQGLNLTTGRVPQLFGLSVVETTAIPENEFLVGAREAATIFDRQESTITVSTDHADFFTKGLVAIKATCRLASVVHRPAALVYGQFGLGESPSINA